MERNVAPMETARRTHPEAAGHPSLRLADLLVQAKLPVFAVLDGAKFDDLPYSLMRLGLVHRPLYVDRGAQTRDFDQTAPRLVWLDQTADSPDWSVDRPCSPQVVAQVLDMLEKNLSAGVFWICAAGGNSLYRHLRRINMVRVPASSLPEDSRPRHQSSDWQAMLFRHADANVLAQVLPCLGEARRSSFLGPAQAIHFAPDTVWSDDELVTVSAAAEPGTSGMLTLDAGILACIEARRKQRLGHFVRAELTEYRDQVPDYERIIEAACRRAIAYGFETIEDVLTFARTECDFGPRFEMMPQHSEALYYLSQSTKAPAERIYYARRACLEAKDWNGTSM